MSPFRGRVFYVSIIFCSSLLFGQAAKAQSASALYGKTYNFLESGSQCVIGGCLGFTEAGRIQILNGGTILYFFGNHRGGYQSQGIRLVLNRSVSLGGGRVPRGFTFGQLTDVRRGAISSDIQALGNLPFRSGTGTTSFNGSQVQATLSLSFAGQLAGGGNGAVNIQLNYTLRVDGTTGRFLGGSGSLQGSGSSAGRPVTFTGNSTVTPR